MYLGEYISPVGEKNRIALPKRLRDNLRGDSLLITRGYEGCLMLLEAQDWERLQEILEQSPLLNMSVRDTKRFLLGGAVEITLDAQGRFVLPESLIQYADINSSVTFLGVGEWMEAWSTEVWQAKVADLKQNAGEIADRLENK